MSKRCAVRKTLKANGEHPLPHESGELVAVFNDYQTAKQFLDAYFKLFKTMPYHITSCDDYFIHIENNHDVFSIVDSNGFVFGTYRTYDEAMVKLKSMIKERNKNKE